MRGVPGELTTPLSFLLAFEEEEKGFLAPAGDGSLEKAFGVLGQRQPRGDVRPLGT